MGSEDMESLSAAGHGHSLSKAVNYGNMAQEFDMMVSQLSLIQTEYLNAFKHIINCEVASVFFLNGGTHELLLFSATNHSWYRIPSGAGIAGYCAQSGEMVNIPNVYADPRFNR